MSPKSKEEIAKFLAKWAAFVPAERRMELMEDVAALSLACVESGFEDMKNIKLSFSGSTTVVR